MFFHRLMFTLNCNGLMTSRGSIITILMIIVLRSLAFGSLSPETLP